ncbi:hypothetical protein [Pseudomonas sp. TH31]|uniref:hypothetical protein n=1 Tax=Pseudomonas sp. TH31 TaxID=2796396 RepID=UPI001912DDA6|nr:hypothetical protein [Pseudomonas sp. TH31]MBK5415379.1 hypothetical protein [Pseudomonas sp. TH31]
MHFGTDFNASESTASENGGEGIFEFFRTAFNSLSSIFGEVVEFFKRLFSPNSSDNSPIKPAPFTPSPVYPAPADVLPYSPSTTSGKRPDDIWGGFRQGPDGNCVTVASIKAAMMKFGQKPTDVFTEVKKVSNGYEVVMRDGFKLQLRDSELQQASRGAQFQGHNQEMISDANFLFAVSAKRAQMENNDGIAGRSFSHAIKSLNDGEHSREGLLRLGLKDHIRPVSLDALKNGMIGTVERRGHSVAVIGGIEENYGQRGRTPQYGIATGLV